MKEEEYDRNAIIAANPLIEYCRARGWKPRRAGREWKCLCPLHKEDTPSFMINPEKQLWHCHGCRAGGSVIDLHARLRGITSAEAMRELCLGNPAPPRATSKAQATGADAPPPQEVARYNYEDATGCVRFQVVRYEPKTFKQCRFVDGARVWNMDGVERLPYRLPELLASSAEHIWIVEGEKDVDILRAAGETATCNPGGAGKWVPAFSQYLRDKCVHICPDRDDAGQKHGKQVLKSLEGICRWARWVELPPEWNGVPVKDIADFREACGDNATFRQHLEHLQARAPLIERAIEGNAFSALELEDQYIAEKKRFNEVTLRLANWLPGLNLRPLGPGDVLGIAAGTGQLKTAVAQNILAANPKLEALFFQLELSGPLMFERAAAIATGIETGEIEKRYLCGEGVDWQAGGKLEKLLVCPAGVNMKQIDEEICRSSAKFGGMPKVFVIDYIQLIRGAGNRYERVSEACEEAKRLAKKWNMIAILVSQISRKQNEGEPAEEHKIREVKLHDAKESGSFENSCSVVLGVWKTAKAEMCCRVLKNTKGLSGNTVAMKIWGGTTSSTPLEALCKTHPITGPATTGRPPPPKSG